MIASQECFLPITLLACLPWLYSKFRQSDGANSLVNKSFHRVVFFERVYLLYLFCCDVWYRFLCVFCSFFIRVMVFVGVLSCYSFLFQH